MSSKLKLFFIILVMASVGNALSNELLAKSDLLKKSGVRLFIGEQQDQSIVFFNDALDQLEIKRDGSNSWLVTEHGSISLKEKSIKTPIEAACGDGSDATGFARINKSNHFVATGNNAPLVLSWHPASSLPFSKSSCLSDVLSLGNIIEQHTNQLPNTGGAISTISVKHRYTKQEKLIKCITGSSEVHGNNEVYIESSENCLKDNFYEYGIFNRTIVSSNNSCRIVLTAELALDSAPNKPGDSLEEFLGVLVVKFNESTEEWLFWNSPGYEGAGVYSIKMEDLTKRDKPSEEWVVYTGC